MPSANDCWGIEVGANALKAMRLQRSGQSVSLTEFGIFPYKKVLTTPDINAEETIRLALNEFKARHELDKATVVVSVPGHSAFARFAKLPPVEPKKVPDIVKFEAVQQIPFPIDQVEWDYQTFQDADSPDVEVGIFAITRERVMNWLANFRSVGIPVHGVSLTPVASYNALAHDLELGPDSPGTVVLDIGTSATDLIIVEGSRLWLRTIPIGGHHFTEALVQGFKLSYSKAEKIKREAATSKYARQIFQAMRPVFVDLIGEVQKSLGFYQSANRDAELSRLIGLGSTFRLPGLQKFLKQQLQFDVQRLQGFQRLEASSKLAAQFNDNACSLAPAYGLALQGLEVERVSCNLLPVALARRQIWQRKQPWMVAASLMLAASAGIAYSSNIADRNAFEENQPIRNEIQAVIRQAEQAQSDLQAIEGGSDPRLRIENIRTTQDYRHLWPMILNDIEQALQSSRPQAALLSGDAEAVKAIPRPERRQLAVQSIDYQYLPDGEAPQQRNVRGGGPAFEDEEYGPGGGRNGGGRTGGGTTGGGGGDGRPAFQVTLTGTTPIGEAYKFLDETVVAWLQQNEERLDRPYLITDVELDDVMPADAAPETDRRGRRDSRRGLAAGGYPGLGGDRRGGRRDGGPGMEDAYMEDEFMDEGMMDEPGMMDDRRGARRTPGRGARPRRAAPRRESPRRQQEPVGIDALLPSDPLAEEDKQGDWRFVIRWRVEVLDPEEHRERSAQPDEDEQTDQDLQPVADAEGQRE